MIGMALAKGIYALPTWSRIARLVAEHDGLRSVLGCAPSQWACYRFTRQLREHSDALADCLSRVLSSLRERLPEMGRDVAIDGSDLPAYANGQRYLSKHGPERERYSDPDASWGHRSAVSTRKGGGLRVQGPRCRLHRGRPAARVDDRDREGCGDDHRSAADRRCPRESKRSRDLYASRGAVEREFGRLKHEWALLPLRVRGLDRVRLHADLTILAQLGCALAKARLSAVVV